VNTHRTRTVSNTTGLRVSDENFFVGAAIPVDATISGGGKATIQFTTQTDDRRSVVLLAMERGGLHVLAVELERGAGPALSWQRPSG